MDKAYICVMQSSAPAKINLYLHITGKRPDGYHLLDSLVAFTAAGDELILEPASNFEFHITGPMAGRLADEPIESNLVVRAARQLAAFAGQPLDVKLTLVKKLPVASGIGGGSSDAAAALRLLAAHFGIAADHPRVVAIAADLGSDIPCCLELANCYLKDTGTIMDPAPPLPLTHIVLVNPNQALPTPAVYKARQGDFTPAQPLEQIPQDAAALAAMLATRRNDLTDAACQIMPAVRTVLDAIAATEDCLLARMSGSGATCFGLYPNRLAARQAAEIMLRDHPDWWVVPTHLLASPAEDEVAA